VYDNGVRHLFVGLESEDLVARLKPDFSGLAQRLPDTGLNCFAGSSTRYKSRMFGPGLGVSEDPATGSAAGPLAVHLARYERIAFDTEIEIRQGLEIGRPSTLYARVGGSADRITSVEVGGSAVIVAHGEFSLP
jgi:trans-2,3-dihydro-3-hydroxyanthranilate isomerase